MGTLTDKVALVTGAGSGIGRAVALTYAQRGARVIVSDIQEAGGQETLRLIAAQGGVASFVRADVSKPEECEALMAQTVSTYGQLDVACNNAGIGGPNHRTADYPVEDWQKVLATNLSSIFYCMKYELPRLVERGGAIVNMSSVLGQVGLASSPAYVASKHGVVGLTRAAAVEYGGKRVRVNAVGPSFIMTPLMAPLAEDRLAMKVLTSMHPLGRLGTAEEVAELVAWLSSDQASFVTGSFYAIDGGYLAR